MALDISAAQGAMTGARGDPNRNRINLLRGFDQNETRSRIEDLISRPLPHG